MDVKFKRKMVLNLWHKIMTSLWRCKNLPLVEHQISKRTKQLTLTTKGAYDTSTISELVGFLHADAFSPLPYTWLIAIKNISSDPGQD